MRCIKKKQIAAFMAAGISLTVLFLNCLPAKSQGLVEKSGQWDRIRHGEYLIENVTWNVQAAKSVWSETIFCDTINGIMGWRWDFSGETDLTGNYQVKTFPEIIFGRKPYNGYTSTTPQFPVEVGAARFELEYEYIANASGIYNTSTDISFTDSKNPNETNIRAKIMIWFDHKNMPFFEAEKLKPAVIDGIQYTVFIDTTHVGPEGKWVFIALLPENLPFNGRLNLHEYFDYFLSEGALKSAWYLSSIEIGSEIASGKGEVIFKKFVIH